MPGAPSERLQRPSLQAVRLLQPPLLQLRLLRSLPLPINFACTPSNGTAIRNTYLHPLR